MKDAYSFFTMVLKFLASALDLVGMLTTPEQLTGLRWDGYRPFGSTHDRESGTAFKYSSAWNFQGILARSESRGGALLIQNVGGE